MADDNKNRKEAELKLRALQTLAKSQVIKNEVDRQYANISKFMQTYPENKLNEMDWMGKEKVLAEADVLFEKLRKCEEQLKVLDAEYEILREEVNAFYGREVMKSVLPKDFFEKHSFDADPPDAADWWKTQE
jgi:archaellum component FlaC